MKKTNIMFKSIALLDCINAPSSIIKEQNAITTEGTVCLRPQISKANHGGWSYTQSVVNQSVQSYNLTLPLSNKIIADQLKKLLLRKYDMLNHE